MKTSQIQKWEKIRNKGKKKFIFQNGVLRWGLTTGLLFSVIMYWIGEPHTLLRFVSFLVLALIFFPIGGYFWGLWVWTASEKEHQKAIKKQSDKI